MLIPVVSTRDAVLFPEERLDLAVGRRRTLLSLRGSTDVLVLAQRREGDDDPGPDDHHLVGCTASLVRAREREGGGLVVSLLGRERATVESMRFEGERLLAEVSLVVGDLAAREDSLLRGYAARVAKATWPDWKAGALGAELGSGRLADIVIGAADLPLAERQALLEELRPAVRAGRVLREAPTWRFRRPEGLSWLDRVRRRLF